VDKRCRRGESCIYLSKAVQHG